MHKLCIDTIGQAAVAELQAAQSCAQDLADCGLHTNLNIDKEWEQLQQAVISSLMSAFRHIINDAQDAIRIPGKHIHPGSRLQAYCQQFTSNWLVQPSFQG